MYNPCRAFVHGQLLFAYIMAGRANRMLYVGATSNPVQRAGHRKQGVVEEFTRKYGARMICRDLPLDWIRTFVGMML
jgi:predicted GIY-YIG superfamily endonuclease